MSLLMTVDNIDFAYRQKSTSILKGCSFTLKEGQILSLLGANGAGKSTLLSIVMGWYKPDAGNVLIEGTPLDSMTAREIGKAMSLVPQSENLPFNFTILDYVLMGRTPYLGALDSPGTKDEEIARGALESVGLAGWENRGIKKLSGGEKQLVTIARSLCQKPKILLLDEPTSSLDLKHKGEIITVLKDLAAKGMAILFTSHDPQFTAALSDRVSLMKNGKILAEGSMKEMFTPELLGETYGRSMKVSWIDGAPLVGY